MVVDSYGEIIIARVNVYNDGRVSLLSTLAKLECLISQYDCWFYGATMLACVNVYRGD
jgi:hypothetical protein